MKLKKIAGQIVAVAAGFGVYAGTASAASYIDAAALTAGTADITATINTVATNSWPLAFLVTGLTIAIGLFKKFTKKSAS
jgi:hypothetical protein